MLVWLGTEEEDEDTKLDRERLYGEVVGPTLRA